MTDINTNMKIKKLQDQIKELTEVCIELCNTFNGSRYTAIKDKFTEILRK